MDDLLSEFLTETTESLGALDIALLKLEQVPNDQPTLSLIFRMVHTIKGTCGFLGLARLEHVAHAGENVLGRVRDGLLAVTPDTVTAVLAALDRIKEIVAALTATGEEPAGDDSALIAALDAIAAGEAPLQPAAGIEPSAMPEAALPPEAVLPADPGSQTIRVAVDVLEDLMTLVSELVLSRNQLLQLARTRQDTAYDVPLQRLSQITSDLQEGVMKTRMQPIGTAWNKMPRLVRDLARDLDKKIDLVLQGADTELDRQVLEMIRDPLTHMVRNSGDHGLESAAERRACGKPETGRITLNAYHEGGHIIIEVADDGGGLPVDRIRAKILAQGLAAEADIAGMTDTQIQRFIFRAGFSTAAAITAVSGRGVGMDVVKTNIERIGGTIDLRSTAGQGTIFIIKIPLTLAIVSALIVAAGGERFAIPQISVVELVRARLVESRPDLNGAAAESRDVEIERIDGTPVLRLRDRLLPLVSLNELLELGGRAPEGPAGANVHIVVAQVGGNMLGIVVDQVFDTEEIVVKPVAPILRHIAVFSGNTILGDGAVIMILDPNGIARATGIGAAGESRARAARIAVSHSGERTPMLLFHAGGRQPMAVPLGLVARLEDVPLASIERSGANAVMQYRGRLMPLVAMSSFGGGAGAGAPPAGRTSQPVLVFSDRERSMGLLVDEIVDVVDEHLDIQLSHDRPGLLGTAVIAGRATDVIDTAHWVTQAFADWFRGTGGPLGGRLAAQSEPHVLLIEDNPFFRHMLGPMLQADGYRVTIAPGAAEALALRDHGQMFDAIVSDIEMPGIDGIAFARALRDGGAWHDLPLIAFSGRAEPGDVAAGLAAGFSDYVPKFDRDSLMGSLRHCLSPAARAA